MEEYIRQADEYKQFIKDSDKSKFLQNWMVKDMSHPFPAIRAAEVMKWFGGFKNSVLGSASTTGILSSSLNW